VLGAVCPRTGQSVGLLAPYLNTDSVNAFFKEFKKETHPGVHVVMSWDQAGFPMSKNVKVPENVTLMPLPAYSPELNPIENLWHYLRSHYCSNRSYADSDDLLHAAVSALQKSVLAADLIKSVCITKYAERTY
jgi:transposase